MNGFFYVKNNKTHFAPLRLLALVLLSVLLFCVVGCKKKIDYFDYASEVRKNIFLAKTDTFSLRIYDSVKESPYASDGVPQERFSRLDAYLHTPEGNKTVHFTFTFEEKNYGGEMSYDNVRGEYYYSASVPLSDSVRSLPCTIRYGEEEYEMTANSVLTETTLSPREALHALQKYDNEVFSSMTDKYGFAGEIYVRLLYESAPYYYFGVIDRQGKCIAFLMNAETGKVLAKREN